MSCAFTTPVAALNAVLVCAQQALGSGVDAGETLGVPGQIVVGGAGADSPFSCCDAGLLAVTYDNVSMADDSSERRRVSGNGACTTRAVLDIHVKVLRCIQTYNITGGGATDGGAVSPAQRTADSLKNVREGWYLMQALNCCVIDTWRGCTVDVLRQDIIAPRGQCTGHDTTLRVTLTMCCPPTPR